MIRSVSILVVDSFDLTKMVWKTFRHSLSSSDGCLLHREMKCEEVGTRQVENDFQRILE